MYNETNCLSVVFGNNKEIRILVYSSRWRVRRNDMLVNCHFGILRCCTADVEFEGRIWWCYSLKWFCSFCCYGFSLSHEMEEGGYTVEYNCISLYQKNIFRLPIKKEKQCFRFLRFKLGSVCLKKIFCPFFDVDCRKHGDINCVIFYVVISMPLRESQPPVYNSRLLTQIQWALSFSLGAPPSDALGLVFTTYLCGSHTLWWSLSTSMCDTNMKKLKNCWEKRQNHGVINLLWSTYIAKQIHVSRVRNLTTCINWTRIEVGMLESNRVLREEHSRAPVSDESVNRKSALVCTSTLLELTTLQS